MPRTKKKSYEQKKKADVLRKREKRSKESGNETRERLSKDKQRHCIQRELETFEEKQARICLQKKRQDNLRDCETIEEKQARLSYQRKQQESLRDCETLEKKHARLSYQRKEQESLRDCETLEKKHARLSYQRKEQEHLRVCETTDEKQERLCKDQERHCVERERETLEKKQERLHSQRKRQIKSRQSETSDEKRKRLDLDSRNKNKLRTTESVQKTQERLSKAACYKRKHRNECRDIVLDDDTVISEFLEKVHDSANYVCCCCHRLMFRRTVVRLKEEKYTKVSQSLLQNVLAFRQTSYNNEEWICRTCHLTLKRGNLPSQSKANNLSLVDPPKELVDLNALELRLLCQRIAFMKMVGLPRGKQHGIHGPAVNVPAKLDAVCEVLPRLPSESQVVAIKLKRSLKHSSHYMYESVRPEVVMNALRWLKKENPHYAKIEINENWIEDSTNDDSKLWEAVSQTNENECSIPKGDETVDITIRKRENVFQRKDNRTEVVTLSDQNDYRNEYETLMTMARQSGMHVIDVPGDGNCMFYAFWYHLERIGITDTNVVLLRNHVADYMIENKENYIEFVATRMRSEDLANADTEQPTAEDLFVNEITDRESQREIQWIRYIDDLRIQSWGDHLVVQALADMYSLKVNVHSTSSHMIHTVSPRLEGNEIQEVDLGLLGQSHYVIFEPCAETAVEMNQHDDNGRTHCIQTALDEVSGDMSCSPDEEDLREQEEYALEEASKVRGLPYETSMMSEDPELLNKIISVAPADGEKPMPLLSDPNFEELSNPDKYPDGTNALTAERPVHLNPRKYFNQRLLDVDGRFSRCIDYIFSAQYATECQQVTGDINHYIFRRASGRHFHGKRLTAGMVKNVEQMKGFIKSDHAYRMLKNVRGTPAYFQTIFYDVLGMVRQLGIPTWFFTVSSADMQWPDVIQTIARQYGTILTDEDVKRLSFTERSQWLRRNPVTAARQFQYRLELLFRDVLKSKAQPLGEIVDYVIRIEFQARGSPHAHTLLWVKDAPKIDSDADETVASFVDKYVSCTIPDEKDKTLQDLVTKLQSHTHSSYCRTKGQCRFSFPRPPSPITVVAKEPDNEMAQLKKQCASRVLQRVKDVMYDEDTSKDATLEHILNKACVSLEDYIQQLLVSQRGKTIVLKRSPAESYINPYNPVILKAWQANMDIQYIIDAYACVMYIAAYMTKNEKGIGELLKQVCKEYKDQEIKHMLRRVGSVFLNHREVSAQEAVYRILSMPMKQFSREVLFVNTDARDARAAVLKPQKELDDLGDEEENIFQSNVIERYSLRPTCIENLCLADFAANYKVKYGKLNEEGYDAVPDLLDTNNEEEDVPVNLPKEIKLNNNRGMMYKRKRPAVIRFHKFSIEKNPSDFYRAKLMLYLPWRNEDVDLLGGFPDFASYYFHIQELIAENESKFTENLEMVEQAIHYNAEFGPPEHAWANVAPGAEHDNLQDESQGVEVERDIDQLDLDANAELIEGPKSAHGSEIIARYDAEAERQILSDVEYRKIVRGLNEKQAQIVSFNRKWCKETVLALKQKKIVKPYHVFMSGPGGVGKSHVIKLVHSDVRKLFRLSNAISISDITVLLTAPTGVAAFNIGGMTIHSALSLQTRKYGGDHISFDKLNTLRSKLENLQLLIIDEISMVGSDMLLDIHKRLQKIKGLSDDSGIFGNVSILAVGDMYQLPPVLQSQIYQPVKDPVERLQGNLWKDNFRLHELHEVMRQKDDCAFAEMLCRIRTGNHTEADILLLESRKIEEDNPNYPHDALHVFAYNCDVDERNLIKLKELEPNEDNLIYIHASDDKTDSTGQVNMTKMNTSQKRSETAGLHTILVLTVGARVMLTYNIDTADGLVNGVLGTVQNIVRNDNGTVHVILVQFDDQSVGKATVSASQWKQEYPDAVPIKRHEARYEKGNRKGAQIARRQFPLTLAWAVTIHKCQGLTVDTIVVNMKKARRFGKGQAYVAFSRVKTLEGLYIVDFDPAGIKANQKVEDAMVEMRQNTIPAEELNLAERNSEWTIIGHLNIRYFLPKLQDILSARQVKFFNRTDVMCFTETYLTDEQNIDIFSEEYQYRIFRCNVPSEKNHGGLHGVMVCVKQNLQSQEFTVKSEGLECKFVQVKVQESEIIVAVVYRKPLNSLDHFCQRFRSVISSLPLHLPVFILGDFNDDLTEKQESKLVVLMKEFGFEQFVTMPTTDRGTLIDHIYHNNVGTLAVCSKVNDTYFSDHDITFCSFKNK